MRVGLRPRGRRVVETEPTSARASLRAAGNPNIETGGAGGGGGVKGRLGRQVSVGGVERSCAGDPWKCKRRIAGPCAWAPFSPIASLLTLGEDRWVCAGRKVGLGEDRWLCVGAEVPLSSLLESSPISLSAGVFSERGGPLSSLLESSPNWVESRFFCWVSVLPFFGWNLSTGVAYRPDGRKFACL